MRASIGADCTGESTSLLKVGEDEGKRKTPSSSLHGVARAGSGFNIVEVVSEYRALRASVLHLWRESNPTPDAADLEDIVRFNESIDQSLATAVWSYTQRVDHSRHMFLAMLSHDLRNPLNYIRLATGMISDSVLADPESASALAQIESQTLSMTRLIRDLVDFSSTGVGGAIPLRTEQVNLETLCLRGDPAHDLRSSRSTLRREAGQDSGQHRPRPVHREGDCRRSRRLGLSHVNAAGWDARERAPAATGADG